MFSAGYEAGLKLTSTLTNPLDYMCRNAQGIKVLLHNPADVPNFTKNFFRIQFGQEVLVSVKPKMITTSDELRDYDPNRRGCYFNGERQLRFFKMYTQNNCELECLSNYTKNECGCVKFSSQSREPYIYVFIENCC